MPPDLLAKLHFGTSPLLMMQRDLTFHYPFYPQTKCLNLTSRNPAKVPLNPCAPHFCSTSYALAYNNPLPSAFFLRFRYLNADQENVGSEIFYPDASQNFCRGVSQNFCRGVSQNFCRDASQNFCRGVSQKLLP